MIVCTDGSKADSECSFRCLHGHQKLLNYAGHEIAAKSSECTDPPWCPLIGKKTCLSSEIVQSGCPMMCGSCEKECVDEQWCSLVAKGMCTTSPLVGTNCKRMCGSCGKEVHCPDIEPIENADVRISSKSPYGAGSVANVTCDPGFKRVGQYTITCLRNGSWSGPVPYCSARSCRRDLKKLEKGRKCWKRCKNDADCRGSFYTCQCDDWCGKSCFNPNAECPLLSNPRNGYVAENGWRYGQIVTYGCNEGFDLSGPPTRRCRSDRKWSGQTPSCVPFSACGNTGEDKQDTLDGKITKGTKAEKGAWPWQVNLMHSGRYSVNQIHDPLSSFAGGSVISDEWILSAAHIFTDSFRRSLERDVWKNTFLIVVGMTKYPRKDLEIPEHIQVFDPETVIVHPDFDRRSFDYDVALIRVGRKLTRGPNDKFVTDENYPVGKLLFTRYVRPVCLPCMKGDPLKPVDVVSNFDKLNCNQNEKPVLSLLADVGTPLMVTGFGTKSSVTGETPDNLQQGLLRMYDKSKCAETIQDVKRINPFARFTNRMFCAAGGNETFRIDTCDGDSGGPVVRKFSENGHSYWTQIGIVSWGVKCAGKHPGFYASVPSIMNWVWQTLEKSKTELKCKEMLFPELTNYNITSCPGKPLGSKCNAECQAGYRIMNKTKRWEASCKLNPGNDSLAEWNLNDAPTCKLIKCPQLEIGSDQEFVDKSCNNDVEINSLCSVQCRRNFKVEGKKAKLQQSRCVLQEDLITASWEPVTVESCEEITCSDNVSTEETYYNISQCQSGMTVGSNCSFKCTDGYKFTGGKDVWMTSCQIDPSNEFAAKWDFSDAPACIADDPCEESPCLNGGKCTKVGGGFQCICLPRHAGKNCEIDCNEPSWCPVAKQLCRSNSFVTRQCKTSCGVCKSGSWNQWAPWSDCSQTCGGGERERLRSCQGPRKCMGNPREKNPCRTNSCPFEDIDIGRHAPSRPTWGEWTSWKNCDKTCGGGIKRRARSCQGNRTCDGISSQAKQCNTELCPGIWSNWNSWIACSASCGSGKRSRTRLCQGPGTCVGTPSEKEECNTNSCPGVWNTWYAWGICSASCGGGERSRIRTCRGPGDCIGKSLETEKCKSDLCPGNWNVWGSWGICSVSCSGGKRLRTRVCLGPGACVGNKSDVEECSTKPCPGIWSNWSFWTVCSATCGGGGKSRSRLCKGPGVCVGNPSENLKCNTESCPGAWSQWTSWTRCSASCGGGDKSRVRLCQGPGTCVGMRAASKKCSTRPCPGIWSGWVSWSSCSASCGTGEKTRSRRCQGSGICIGRNSEENKCNTNPCPGVWGRWSPWKVCTQSCGGGERSRSRVCQGPGNCIGKQSETDQCNTPLCPGVWEAWNLWTSCSASCDSGRRSRTRRCHGPGVCVGNPSEKDQCNTNPCPGVWGVWSSWTICSASCDSGQKSRTRLCRGPGVCIGNPSEKKKCNTNPCPGVWAIWSSWTSCSASCDSGRRSRTRLCHGPGVCIGNRSEKENCNTNPCPSVWGEWSLWTICSSSCGGGESIRSRQCQGPGICVGKPSETAGCNFNICPGSWNNWSSWSDCSATCDGGVRSRVRSCRGSGKCTGEAQKTEQCSITQCPAVSVSSRFFPATSSLSVPSIYSSSPSSTWLGCSKPCGGGRNIKIQRCSGRSGCSTFVKESNVCNPHPCTGSLIYMSTVNIFAVLANFLSDTQNAMNEINQSSCRIPEYVQDYQQSIETHETVSIDYRKLLAKNNGIFAKEKAVTNNLNLRESDAYKNALHQFNLELKRYLEYLKNYEAISDRLSQAMGEYGRVFVLCQRTSHEYSVISLILRQVVYEYNEKMARYEAQMRNIWMRYQQVARQFTLMKRTY